MGAIRSLVSFGVAGGRRRNCVRAPVSTTLQGVTEDSVRESGERHIRPMNDEDRQLVRAIVRRAFPVPVRFSFTFGSHALVFDDGVIRGGVVVKMFRLPSGRRAGLVAWIFVDPAAQGRGIGGALLDAALELLESNGCEEVFASISGDNTDSSRRFSARGFDELSAGALFTTYRIGALSVVVHAKHLFDVGYCLWRRPAQRQQPRPRMQLLSSAILHLPIAALIILRTSNIQYFDPIIVYRLTGTIALFLLVRTVVSWTVARIAGIRLRYRMWESGFVLAAVAAVAFGVLMPIPGSLYPRERNWSFRDVAHVLGLISIAGLISSAVLGASATAIMELGAPPVGTLPWLVWMRRVAVSFIVVDGVLPVFPFEVYAANRIRRWSTPTWIVTAAFSLSAALLIAI